MPEIKPTSALIEVPQLKCPENLALFVFTYNRADSLRSLLNSFLKGPFRECQITILDNCSSDSTPAVCADFEQTFRNFRTVRHPKNIGGLANYLRAIELARAEYTWVVCDDDNYSFSAVDDLVRTLDEASVDLISIGVDGHALPGGFSGNAREFSFKHPFFLGHSLVPALIFRTSLFTSECIRKGYDNVHTMFPHFPFLAQVVSEARSLYVTREKIIFPGNNLGYSTFGYLRGWLQSSLAIPDKMVARNALSNVFGGKHFWHMLLFSFLTERAYRPKKWRNDFWRLFKEAAIGNFAVFLKLAAATPLLALPEFAHKSLWKAFARHRNRQGKQLPNFDEER